jgi:hypothetical protein
MRKSYLVAAAGLLLMLGASAQAGGRGGGLSTTPMTPHGLTSPGGHNGFETFTHTTPSTTPGTPGTTTTERLPGGWDSGKADWKSGLQSTNPVLTTRPPGLSR